MIWHYFPIGMRFPVPDFSAETKRTCWQIALSAAYASDARGTTLYEAIEPFDCGSQSAVYTCIVCFVPIKQSRAAGKTMHALDGLMTRLCLHNPLVQANYLESFGPYPQLGMIDENGTVISTEAGEPFLPAEPVEPMLRNEGWNLLFACENETLSRGLGSAAAENGFCVDRVLIADGEKGAMRALVSGTRGRYDAVSITDDAGNRCSVPIGVIPGKTAVLEAARTGDGFAQVGSLVRGVSDLGYRKLLVAGDAQSICSEAEDPRLHSCEITVLSDEPDTESCRASEWILDRIDFAGKARAADFVIVCADRRKTAEAVLSRLTELGRGCCLVSDIAPDPDETARTYPTLRCIVPPPGPDVSFFRFFSDRLLPLIGKSVVKNIDS
ncbi:MAG: hypothetical protein IJJ86_02610 [Clostridia bacterium]|nr:hypothetical protein [Clostridia bacterium]